MNIGQLTQALQDIEYSFFVGYEITTYCSKITKTVSIGKDKKGRGTLHTDYEVLGYLLLQWQAHDFYRERL